MSGGESKYYILPPLPFGFGGLKPYISEEQLRIHYEKHHQAYVAAANQILQKIEVSRKENLDLDMKGILKSLSFNVGGHILHSLFWQNLTPPGKIGGKPDEILSAAIAVEFGSFERFQKEFTEAALSIEGSGWATLAFCEETNRPLLMQIEKHNTNIYPGFRILMVLDMFEHAYYFDYKNEKAKYVEAFWKILNWETVSKRLEE